jgi:hypothetical protein
VSAQYINEDNQQVYSQDEIKQMHERDIITDSRGTIKRVGFPVENNPISTKDIKRPQLTSYQEALEWNKQAQEHTEKAISFTTDYARVFVEPKNDNKIFIMNVSDWHWGHKDTDYEYLDKVVKMIENTPNAYMVFGWNLLDAAIPAQFPDGVMWSNQTAQEQVYTFNDLLRRLQDKNKIIGGIGESSCHEGWAKRKTGWAVYRELFSGINCPLLNNGSYLDIVIKDQNYRLGLFHKTPYYSQFNKTHAGDRAMDRVVDAEIVFTSHLHQAAVGQTQRYNPPFTKETAVVSSGTCKLMDKFGRNNFGKEGERCGQGIILWGDKHKFNVVYDFEVAHELMTK